MFQEGVNPIGKAGITGPSLQVSPAEVAFLGYSFTDPFEGPQSLLGIYKGQTESHEGRSIYRVSLILFFSQSF